MGNPIEAFFKKYHAIPVSDRNGAARYEHANGFQLADWLRDRHKRVKAGNLALAGERSELIAACRARADAIDKRPDRNTPDLIDEFVAVIAALAVATG
jgi:hypothetical protein